MCKLFFHPDERLEPVAIDQPLTAGEMLPIAGGIEVIHTPGHCAGQVAQPFLAHRRSDHPWYAFRASPAATLV
jgi:hypothetical protein